MAQCRDSLQKGTGSQGNLASERAGKESAGAVVRWIVGAEWIVVIFGRATTGADRWRGLEHCRAIVRLALPDTSSTLGGKCAVKRISDHKNSSIRVKCA
jgi:hypothetical protein